eukprot:1142471-Pelagomonas_calceolata.AAC.9
MCKLCQPCNRSVQIKNAERGVMRFHLDRQLGVSHARTGVAWAHRGECAGWHGPGTQVFQYGGISDA